MDRKQFQREYGSVLELCAEVHDLLIRIDQVADRVKDVPLDTHDFGFNAFRQKMNRFRHDAIGVYDSGQELHRAYIDYVRMLENKEMNNG